MSTVSRNKAVSLLKKYNKQEFHLRHAVTVEAVMRDFAQKQGCTPEEVDFWGIVGLLHDVVFEMYPEEHCKKAPELLKEINAPESLVHAVCSHGFGICYDTEPVLPLEKTLFACDELTGLIGAAALMRPSKSVSDMELKSLKKKYKDKKFAAGCSREVIERGAAMLGIELDGLLLETLDAMKAAEKQIEKNYSEILK